MQCARCGNVLAEGDHLCAKCGAAVEEVYMQELAAGNTLQDKRYRLDGVLGQGGFGITYRGVDTKLWREVAIKEFFPRGSVRHASGRVLSAGGASAAEFKEDRDKFLTEARTLARFKTPGVTQVFDTFEENNTAYIVMEYLVGQTLRAILTERGKLQPEQALGIMLKAMDALEVVHGEGLLHRDITPSNLMCVGDRVVLIDFGAARAYDHTIHSIIGTPRYAPPEQESRSAKLGPYTDLYALGATMHHMLTGNRPPTIVDRVMGESFSPLPADIPPQLAEAVWACLTLNHKERAQTVADLRKILLGGTRTEFRPGVVAALSLEAAIQNAFPGAEIRIPAGTYQLSRPLNLTQPISLIGTGHQQVVLQCAAGGHVLQLDCDGLLKLEGISFEHQGSQDAHVVKIAQGNVEISKCAFRGSIGLNGAGLLFLASSGGTVRESLFEGCAIGVLVDGDSAPLLQGNICRNNSRSGITYLGSAGGEARQNECSKNVNGIFVGERAGPVLEGNVCFENSKHGIRCSVHSQPMVRKNTCRLNGTSGISVDKEARPTLEENTCDQNLFAGIRCLDTSRPIARRNLCQNNQYCGIYVGEQAEPTLEANTCQKNASHGIAYFGIAAGTARDNLCLENRGDGIHVRERAAPELLSNTCTHNRRYGLAVDHTASPRLFRTWLSGNLLDTVVSLGGEAL